MSDLASQPDISVTGRQPWKIAENRTLKWGSSPPEQRCQALSGFFEELTFWDAWTDSESRPPPPDVPIKNPRPLQATQMLELQGFAVEHNCRLVVTGDTKQHHSVQWGDALQILERSGVIAQATLTKIHCQRIPELRAAIEDLSKDRTGEGFDKLDKVGAIQEIPDDAGRLAAIAEKQIEALKAQRSSLIIASTHGECRAIAVAVRKAMKEKGLLSDSEHSVTRLQRLNLTDSQQRDAVTYEPGQIVEFHRMAKGAVRRGVPEKRFKSGEQWEVLRREEQRLNLFLENYLAWFNTCGVFPGGLRPRADLGQVFRSFAVSILAFPPARSLAEHDPLSGLEPNGRFVNERPFSLQTDYSSCPKSRRAECYKNKFK
jgi:hypothetical protein